MDSAQPSALWALVWVASFFGGIIYYWVITSRQYIAEPNEKDSTEQPSIFIDYETSQETSPDDDWDQICRAAVEKAKSGNSVARTWVTKHVYEKHEVPKPPRADKPPRVDKPPKETKKETPSLTSAKVVEDAVMFLCCLGEKKRKVDPIVKDLCTKKKYEKVENIVKDFYKRS